MAGLLDFSSLDDPQGAGLLSFAMGLMQPGRNPGRASFGEALSNGIGAGAQGYGAAREAQQKRALQAAQLEHQKAQVANENTRLGMAQTEMGWKGEDRTRSIEQLARIQAELLAIDPTGKLWMAYKMDPKAVAEQLVPKSLEPGKVDLKDLSPESLREYSRTGRLAPGALAFKPQIDIVNGVAVDKSTMVPGQVAPQPVGDPIIRGAGGQPEVNPLAARMKNLNDPFTLGANGAAIPNGPLQDYMMRKAAAGATRVNVPVNTEKTYAGQMAEGLAKSDLAVIDMARSSAPIIATAQRIKELVAATPVVSGTFASQRLALEKGFATAGLIDGSRVANTEALVTDLANQTLSQIKASGLGAGQGFTDKDLKFLQDAKSGAIEMSRPNIYRTAELNERAAREMVKQGRIVTRRLEGNPIMGTIGQSLQFDEPPPMKAMPLPPGKMNSGNLLPGATYDIPGKGIYRWTGLDFEKAQ